MQVCVFCVIHVLWMYFECFLDELTIMRISKVEMIISIFDKKILFGSFGLIAFSKREFTPLNLSSEREKI